LDIKIAVARESSKSPLIVGFLNGGEFPALQFSGESGGQFPAIIVTNPTFDELIDQSSSDESSGTFFLLARNSFSKLCLQFGQMAFFVSH
jgi:hypothetical protein